MMAEQPYFLYVDRRNRQKDCQAMMELAREDDRICAITAAMPGGTGLLKFMREYPKRFFDVGIAEEHAISMAGGLAKQGMVPVAAIYSTFLQRAYDQIMQDIALLHLHVILAIDRAGLVGDDGATHHGVFDVGFLRQGQLPGFRVAARRKCGDGRALCCHRRGGDVTLVTYGSMLDNVLEAADFVPAGH